MFMRGTFYALVVFAVLAGGLSASEPVAPGPGTSGDSPAGPAPALDAPRAFNATYRLDSGFVVNVSLSAHQHILARDGTGVRAYPLRVEFSNGATLVEWLDGSFRTLRRDHGCIEGTDTGCRSSEAIWVAVGMPSAYGIALPRILNGTSELSFPYGDGDMESQVSRSEGPEGLRLDVRPPHVEAPMPPVPNGTFWFDGNIDVPSRMQIGQLRWERTSLEIGPALAASGEIQTQRSGLPPADRGPHPFPGASDDFLDAGMDAEHAFEELLRTEAAARSTLDEGGCVMQSVAAMRETQEPRLLLDAGGFEVRFTFQLGRPEGATTTWDVTYEYDAPLLGVGPDSHKWHISQRDHSPDLPGACDALEQGPWPGVAPRAYLDLVREAWIPHGTLQSFTHAGLGPYLTPGDPTRGWDSYAFTFRPAWRDDAENGGGFGLNYQIQWDALQHTLQRMRVHPEDLAAWDARAAGADTPFAAQVTG